MPRFGASFALACTLLLSGCLYGFAGGGLPPHIRTVAVLPFENETPAATLQSEIHERLSREIVAAVRQPEVAKRLAADGSEAVGSTPDEFRALIAAERDKWAHVIRVRGIKAQ